MKAYITKHALTAGIIEVDAEVCTAISTNMIAYKDGDYDCYAHGEGKQWHRTWARAVARARIVRDAKIASLAKSAKKLKALDWPDAEPK